MVKLLSLRKGNTHTIPNPKVYKGKRFNIYMKNKEINIGFDSLQDMNIGEIIELEKQAGGNQKWNH